MYFRLSFSLYPLFGFLGHCQIRVPSEVTIVAAVFFGSTASKLDVLPTVTRDHAVSCDGHP